MVVPTSRRSGPMARWVKVLNAFVEREEWGTRDLAVSIDLSRSAVHRMLHEMAGLGLLTPSKGRGEFRVGPELVRLAVLLADHLDIRHVARPVLDHTMERTGETVILALYAPSRRQFWAVDAAESSHPIRYIWESLRGWSDLYVGSSGKGILAFLPDLEREAILDALPDPVPGLRPTSKEDLRHELAEARRTGYVLSRGERFAGAIGVSAPVRDATGRVIGDVIISWPDNRSSAEKETSAAQAVLDAGEAISTGLGLRSG